MKIYVEEKRSATKGKYRYPSILLVRDNWDDFGYKSLFSIYYQSESSREPIGYAKIFHKGRRTPMLKDFMEHLPASTCSLGVNLNYYRQAKALMGRSYYDYLDVMNDVTFLPGLHAEFKQEDGFNTSLLRDKEPRMTLEQAHLIHFGGDADKRGFEYETRLEGATKSHKVNFVFYLEKGIPGRLMAVIGRNGTGKTQFITRLAKTLGEEPSRSTPVVQFPHLNSVIAISFSPFDDFAIPERTRRFNYSYCGIREPTTNTPLSKGQLLKRLKEAGLEILNERKQARWSRLLSPILDPESLSLIGTEFIDNADEKLSKGFAVRISSGQLAQVLIYSELLAKLRPRSLVLFDEPEIHMHPTALSHLVRSLHNLLDEYDSLGIVCTHSPIVVQEIPSRQVVVFERKGNIPSVRRLSFESFGENLTNITEGIFNMIEVEANYKTVLKKLKKDGMSIPKIETLFGGRLSFNARAYLASLFERDRS